MPYDMARRRVLLLLKPFDVYPPRFQSPPRRAATSNVLRYLDDRCKVHKNTIDYCQEVLRRKDVEWSAIFRSNLSQPISNVDVVVTVGGDGTLLQASHFLDGSIPVLGVNSDPTQADEVDEFSDEFDATRSTGYLCAATARNFEQVLNEVLEGRREPSELSRMSISVNDHILPTNALNDILVAHPCPASVSRFSFWMKSESEKDSSLVHFRSSGLRVCTAAGSTAAMLSAGGFPMPTASPDLQYMVREPISPRDAASKLMHGLVKAGHSMHVSWYSQEGTIYVDGSHVTYAVQHGDVIEISSRAPLLKVYLPQSLL